MINIKYNYLILFILLFTGLIVSGCSKWSSGTTTVEFVIINPANGEPFPNVNVKIVEETSTNKASGGVISEGKTDASGRITFEFTAKRTSKYWYTPVIDTDYFGPYENWEYLIRPKVSSYAIIKNVYNEMRYEIIFYAYLKSIYKNINCEGQTDTLIYHAWSEPAKGSRTYDYTNERVGCVDYETGANSHWWPDGHALVFMGWHKIEWEAIKPGGVTYGVDSVYLDKHESGTIEVLY